MNKVIYSTDYIKYQFYENKSPSRYERRCIDGNFVGCSKCVGYCQYNGHPGFLTEDLRRKHNCINKKCFYYVEKEKPRQVNADMNLDISTKLLQIAKKIIKPYEGMKILRTQQNDTTNWVLKYITISNDYPIDFLEKKISGATGYNVRLEKLNYSFEVCANLILEAI